MVIADFDKDGFPDIAVNDYSNGAVMLYLNRYSIITDVIPYTDLNNNLPADFNLNQNYPNPFNPTTIIKYALPRKSQVNITIYNLLGQIVRNYDQGVQSFGTYEIIWDGKNQSGSKVSSGIYFYRLETENFTASKKMLLLK